MKRFFIIGSVVAMALLVNAGMAQNRKGKDKEAQKPKGAPALPAYLGNSSISGGPVSKSDFDAEILHGIRVKDSAGNPQVVEGFSFTYVERSIYEDSVGNLIPVTEYLNEYCLGDTLSANVRAGITGRSKAGDTVMIDRIKVRMTDGTERSGRSMKLVLTR